MNKELSDRLINCIRRDLNAVLVPELQTDRARAVAAMMDFLIRDVLTDSEQGPASDPAKERAALNARAARHRELPTLERSAQRQALFEVTPDRLATYFATRRPEWKGPRVTQIRQVLGGFSKETFLLQVAHGGGEEGLVLRRDLESGPVETEAAYEFSLVRALFEVGFPVAEPLWQESDPTILGRPFQISRKVRGAVLNGTLQLRSGTEQAAACRQLAGLLARLHAIDPGKLRLREWDPRLGAHDYVRRYVGWWEKRWRERRLEDSAVLEHLFAWLNDNVPQDPEPAVLVHGDAGLQNLMMEDGEAIALLDWELAHFGHPAEDLNYARMWVDAALPWSEFLGCYRAAGGRAYNPRHTKFFRILNSVRNAVTCAQALDGFGRDEQPQLASAYAGIYYYREFLGKAMDDLESPSD